MAPPPASCPPELLVLDAALRAGPTATAVLERWCRTHQPHSCGRIRVAVAASAPARGNAGLEALLDLLPGERLRHRRVWLSCGDLALSCAQAWYVPDRLDDEMNQALDQQDRPLGEVVAPLGPWRRLLAARLVWSAEEAQVDGRRSSAVLEHRAVLMTAGGEALAVVHELYQQNLLRNG